MNKILDPQICGWDSASYLIFSDNVFGNFIYYSHLLPAISALALGIFVFTQNPRGLTNRILLFVASVFTIWSLIDLVLWATERTDFTMFFWSILIHFDLLIYIGMLYFVYAFLYNKLPSWKVDVVVLLLFLPLILFAHTPLNLTAYDFTNCWREALEGPLWQYYVYNVELLIALWIAILGVLKIRKTEYGKGKKRQIVGIAGVLLFLIAFSIGNILGSIEVDWELGQWGLFGMPIFLAFLSYLIVKYDTFKVQAIKAEILVGALLLLVLSLMFVPKIENIRYIAGTTFVLSLILGWQLILSVRNEVTQRQEIEKLAKKLGRANKRLKELDQLKSEFVSIASHQLRSPLTAIRGYTSMLLEGSYGKLSTKAKTAIEKIGESSRFMSLSVEDYLNVSRIQTGNMKYEYSDFNLRDLAETVADELRPEAIKRGLLVTFKTDLETKGVVHADIGKTKQVIQNLLDNSMKYTPKGSIKLYVHDNKKNKRIMVDIIDTGIGMSEETIQAVFDKFERAHNANDVNVTGTGLGLFVARQMAVSMGGNVYAHSDGEGKGSVFTVELPVVL